MAARRPFQTGLVARSGNRGYRCDILVDGAVVGYIERPDRPSGLGYRSGAYSAYLGGRRVAADDRLAWLKDDLAECIAEVLADQAAERAYDAALEAEGN
jgi:hypothetical protein